MHLTYVALVGQFKKELGNMEKWLDLAIEHGKARSFDPNVLLAARLAPDQFAFVRQVQSCCDTAKFAAARVSGKQPPSQPDTEQTIEELRTRIRSVVEYLGTFTENDFADASTRVISQPRWEGKTMTGGEYFVEHSIPNFFFHLTHAYALLRHNGVPIGKRDYLGPLPLR